MLLVATGTGTWVDDRLGSYALVLGVVSASFGGLIADLLSGLPLQQLASTDQPPAKANGATVAHDEVSAHVKHRPHAQTGATPQLHP